jgi:3-carboxy-cis,cis-muconate cycloisomerase
MVGRTLLQQAVPITFGLKAARWLALTARQVEVLGEQRRRSLALQFGGAAGTLAALGNEGLRVAALLADELDLPLPDLPWHAERDRVANIAVALGVVAGAMAKIAGDIVLLAQTEVGEVSEGAGPGKGGSSAMPHKHNPVDAVMARAAARQAIALAPVILGAMESEHERAAGGWQLEWTAVPALFGTVAGAIARVKSAVSHLEVDAARMRANLEASDGLLLAESLTMALAQQVGRPEAQRIVKAAAERAGKTGMSFRQALREDERVCSRLSEQEIARALDPAAYLGATDAFIDNALATYRAVLCAEP